MDPALVAEIIELVLQEEPVIQQGVIALLKKMPHHQKKLAASDYIALAKAQIGG
jgi:hypothetical protein